MPLNTAILLISFEDFIDRIDLSVNMDSNELTPTIDRVQRKYLPDILCKPLYDEIIAEKLTGYFSPDNDTLVEDYIKDYLVNKVWAKYILRANLKHTQSGYTTFRGDEWGESITDKHRAELIRDQEDTANFYEQELITFLRGNVDTYPLYEECDCQTTNKKYNKAVRISPISGHGRKTRTEHLKGKTNSGNTIKGGTY